MIFLGAGASAPFGPKPYSCIGNEVWRILGEHNVEKICSIAKAKLDEHKMVFDFEAILAIFEFLKDVRKGIVGTGPLLSWLGRRNFRRCTPKKADEVLKALKQMLYQNCENVEDMAEVNRVYDEFFGILKRSAGDIDHDIFTTNYDLIMEKYHWRKETPELKTGFERVKGGHPYLLEFEPKESYGGLSPHVEVRDVRRLFKLHGSIDQKIKDYVAYKYPLGYDTDIQFAEDMMVFPVAEKYITQYPYFGLYRYLQGIPWTVGVQKQTCIVIGFSFRDIPIINAFVSHIAENERKNVKSRIILIDKCPKSVIENLNTRLSQEDFRRINERIDPIEGEFGSTKVFEKLEEKLELKETTTIVIDPKKSRGF